LQIIGLIGRVKGQLEALLSLLELLVDELSADEVFSGELRDGPSAKRVEGQLAAGERVK
jgi:hypothetical protein